MIYYKIVFGNILGSYEMVLQKLVKMYKVDALPSTKPEENVEYFNTLIPVPLFIDYHNGVIHINLINDREEEELSETELSKKYDTVIETDYIDFLKKFGSPIVKPLYYKLQYEFTYV